MVWDGEIGDVVESAGASYNDAGAPRPLPRPRLDDRPRLRNVPDRPRSAAVVVRGEETTGRSRAPVREIGLAWGFGCGFTRRLRGREAGPPARPAGRGVRSRSHRLRSR